ICNIIVEDGGYLLVWIGYVEKGKKVKVAAACGKHTDYVKNIRVSWDESDFGKGPTGTAIKTGKPSIERDIEHGESYSPWREEAVKHGFKSSIALPLIANGKTIGALNIYSAEKDAFDTEEVNLLSQLADDLAYGIFALRNKAERERMEKELINERNLFIGGPVVVFKWKAGEENVPVEYVSPNVKDIFGYTPEELISGKIAYDDIIHPDDRERVISEAQSYRRKGAMQFEQEYRVITVNGEYRWVHDFTTVKKDEGGKITHYHGYLVDITERKKMEKALEKEREQLLSIFDGIDEPIYVVDPETYKILYVNNALKNTFGKDITGKRCYKVFQGLNKSCDFCTNDKIFGENFGKTYVWEFENRKTGKWYRCFDRGIVWPDGRKVRLELAMDITDRVKAEEKLQRAYREVERALKEEQKFKMATAHYFFNPIAIAKGYLDLALEEGDGEDKIKKAIEAITRVEKVVKNVTKSGEIRE
ncbi:MAG TPA: PAS domain S-box protein, partial [Thermoplasmatales archaeon]|nr:PAS domain S-box protein [Thermoplasmatales archaeon]